MKAGIALALPLFSLCILCGCYRDAHLYPILGPLAAQTPPPIFSAKLTGVINSGSLTAKLGNGEVFSGPWQAQSAKQIANQSNAGIAPPFNLSAAWDAVYGPGFYTGHVLGSHLFARTSLTGKQGGILQVEMISQPGIDGADPRSLSAPVITGVAKDDKGNIYKMGF